MIVQDWQISDVKPYPNNPRKNQSAIKAVANSIQEFGWKQPIVVDKNGVVIVGHTRLAAAKHLGLTRVPVVVADNLTKEQVKAYRLADNKTNEAADWDLDKLETELADITDIDMSDFGFDIPTDDIEDDLEDEDDGFEAPFQNAQKALFDGVGEYGIPEIKGVDFIEPVDWISFNMLNSYKEPGAFGVHHFIDDYQFEREWTQIDRQITRLQRATYVTSPDFSLYVDFPKAMQIWNHYRKHWIGAYMEMQGISVIPTIAWSDESSFEWCFDGEPTHKPVAVSTVGVMQSKETKESFLAGYNAMIDRLQPTQILYYGQIIDELKGDPTLIPIESFGEKMKKRLGES
ncbi:hypothetical protein lacNasYZ03_11580 [Lactobacillus nasalidis]|uniref:ParB-like N-terminal domain-containing protein n=1 Tax=Lactobacillus nasalidis TaxID=2797258 RepID=A0ABQ3W4L9_9LACO|nr:DUF4417 domain-containing protein [Lactobacillus nasalidis]GHV97882.1 hypothetical protein lacNasYZ01_10640 [Lactobacillus nasalidis]GHW00112.1 hypothetical protein lacNasYZ02_15410 [Lactobacillus nasalidis]GHW01471.1 hypothetical protein lacNasYZ03_11580 [Lactobacillus nasalidis]